MVDLLVDFSWPIVVVFKIEAAIDNEALALPIPGTPPSTPTVEVIDNPSASALLQEVVNVDE